jgi:S1-C subfamily serine protease
MSDPVSLAAIGAPIVAEGVKFLYGQARALLRAWNQRRSTGTDIAEGESLDVALPPNAALAVQPAAGGADASRVAQASDQLQELAKALAPFAEEWQPLPDEGRTLPPAATTLRELLEAIYRQPLSFQGEQRERTGAELDFEQVLGTVTNSTVTMIGSAAVGDGTHLKAIQKIENVKDSTVTGIETLTIGSNAPRHEVAVDPAITKDAQDRWDRSRDEIENVRRAVEEGDMRRVNSSQQLEERKARLKERGLGLEGIVNEDDSLWTHFLAAGLRAASAVALVALTPKGAVMEPMGTGVLISPRLLMTNHHVLPDADAARGASALFDYGHDENGDPRTALAVPLDAESGFFADANLDFAVVALSAAPPLGARRPVPLIAEPGKFLLGERVNVVGHAKGDRARVSIRANRLVDQDDDWIRYTSDTRRGSSGSPVFNDQWEMVGLHHAGIPDPDAPRALEVSTANEGARVSRIVAVLRSAELDEPTRALVDAALSPTQEVP